MLTLLSVYVDFENNELKLDEETYMTQKDIIEISGLGRTKVTSILNKFINNNILFVKDHPKDARKNIYYLNPDLFFKGKLIDKEMKEQLKNVNIV